MLLAPLAVTGVALVALLAFTDAADSPPSLLMFCFVAFVLAVVGQEFWRGAPGAPGDDRRAPGRGRCCGWSARNRRRYGGYLVHAGIAVLFLGVAASSAFIDQRDVRLSPGESFEIDGYQVTYREADRASSAATAPAPARRSRFGAVLDVRKGDERFTLHPSRNYYSSGDPSLGDDLALLRGRGDERGRPALGARAATSGWRCGPTSARLTKPLREADRKFGDVERRRAGARDRRARRALPQATRRRPPSARSCRRWWPGSGSAAALAVLGALIAVWPAPEARLRRVRSIYSARARPRALAR